MTSTELTSIRTSSTLVTRMLRGAKNAWHAYLTWQARRATVRILHSLDARTLNDIGLEPGEIESFVYGGSGDRMRSYDANWRIYYVR